MAVIYKMTSPCMWGTSACIAASGSVTSGSFRTDGYARIVGTLISSGSLKAGSGLRVEQSSDNGVSYDYVADWEPSACSGSGFSIEVVGNQAKITIRTDATGAPVLRTAWRMRPV